MPIELEFENAGRNRHRVFARLNNAVMHTDTLDIASARARARFLDDLGALAAGANEPLDVNRANQRLIEYAATRGSRLQCARADSAELLAELGVEVISENDDNSVMIWVSETRKTSRIKSVAKLADEEILQLVGDHGAQHLRLGNGSGPDAHISTTDVRLALAVAARRAPRLNLQDRVGQSVWMHEGQLLVVNGANAALYDGTRFEAVEHPRLGQKLIELNAGRAWTTNLEAAVAQMTPAVANQALADLTAIMQNWNWKNLHDAEAVAALVPATLVQSIWTWRPQTKIIGESDAGKSTFVKNVLTPVFGAWVIVTDQSTEAGVRQRIGFDGAPVILDEFDKYLYRDRILELFRTSSLGGIVLRGTQDQAGRGFRVQHIPWFLSIESGETLQQDANRSLRFELNLPTNRGVLPLPGSAALAALGQGLLAAAVWAALPARRLADELKPTRIPGLPGRYVESMSVPAAMCAVLSHGRDVSVEQAIQVLSEMCEGREVHFAASEPDQVSLLSDIFRAIVRIPMETSAGYQEETVGQFLTLQDATPSRRTGCAAPFEARGLRLYYSRRSSALHLFFDTKQVRAQLLRGTQWERLQISDILIRLPDARRAQTRIAEIRPYGITVPWASCLSCLGLPDTQQDDVTG